MTAPLKGILYLVQAERRIKPEPRNLNTDPFMLGEGIRYWTVERIAELKLENERNRKRRK